VTTKTLVFECDVHFGRQARGRKEMNLGPVPPATVPGRVPRVARLLALAHRFENLIIAGQVKGYADIARLGHVTRARVCQIMNLLQLAPDIQEEILFLLQTTRGRDRIKLQQLQAIAAALEWRKQRVLWGRLKEGATEYGFGASCRRCAPTWCSGPPAP
jgi:hypothetical protein